MLEKRDLQLIRLAVRRNLLTPEQGEDCLAVKRQLDDKYSIEEIIRRKGFLQDNALNDLARVADVLAARQGRGFFGRRSRPPPPSRTIKAPSLTPAKPRFGGSAEEESDFSSADDMDAFTLGGAPGPGDHTILDAAMLPQLLERLRQGSGESLPSATTIPRDPTEVDTSPRTPAATDYIDDEEGTMVGLDAPVFARPALHPRAPSRRESSTPFDHDAVTVMTDVRALGIQRKRDSAPTVGDVRAHFVTEPIVDDEGTVRDTVPFGSLSAPPEARPTLDLLEISTFGPYEIQRMVARGRTGDVYLAQHTERGEPVALKMIKPSLARNAAFLARFLSDAQAASEIDSPALVRVLEVGSVGAQYYQTSEYIDGWTLRDRLDSPEPLSLLERVRILRGLAEALIVIEGHDLVHKSITPDNVMLRKDGSVALSGFGLVEDVELRRGNDTVHIVGDPRYVAPEQITGREIDVRTDLYGFGATAFEVLSGRPMFEAEEQVAVVDRHIHAPPPELPREIQEPLRSMYRGLVQKRPEDRVALDTARAALDRALGALDRAPEPAAAKEEVTGSVLARAFLVWLVAVLTLVFAPPSIQAMGWFSFRPALLEAGLVAVVAIFIGLTMVVGLGLVRRGQLPLPGSTTWLVTLEDGAGLVGVAVLIAGFALAPPAMMNLIVSGIASVALISAVYGVLLRRRIAALRPDRGVGHMLAVLGDPRVQAWRTIHAPMLTTLGFLSVIRFGFMAYFQAGV